MEPESSSPSAFPILASFPIDVAPPPDPARPRAPSRRALCLAGRCSPPSSLPNPDGSALLRTRRPATSPPGSKLCRHNLMFPAAFLDPKLRTAPRARALLRPCRLLLHFVDSIPTPPVQRRRPVPSIDAARLTSLLWPVPHLRFFLTQLQSALALTIPGKAEP